MRVSFSFLAFLVWLLLPKGLAGQQPPNIILIFADDLGYGDLSCYGAGGYRTPQLDRMAQQGVRLTHFYAAQAVCSASRAALLTGCYPNRVGISGALFPWSEQALNHQEETLPELLKARGYRTAMIGKWHLGHQPGYLPIHHGFDSYYGLPYSNDMWPLDYAGKRIVDTGNRKSRYPSLPLLEGDKPVRFIESLQDQGELTGLYTRRAVDFIRQKGQQPFFLYLAHSMPHVPIYASPRFLGKSGQGLYGDMMLELDWSMGEIMKALKEAGIDDNTLVIFTSDNGPWLNFGNHSGSSGGLREGKGTAWEGGVRVPCIMRWPGRLPAGEVLNGLATTMDILPTIAAVTGAPLPVQKIDGVNLLPYLSGSVPQSPRSHFVYYYDRNNLKAVRNEEWKLVFAARSQTYLKNKPGMDGWPGAYADTIVPKALYNLRYDPGESRDLQDRFPEVVQTLEAIAAQYRTALGDDIQKVQGTEVRPAALVKKQ